MRNRYYFSNDHYINAQGDVFGKTKQLAVHLKNGYPAVNIVKNGRRGTYYVHRLMLEAFGPTRPSGYECRHLDGNRLNYFLKARLK